MQYELSFEFEDGDVVRGVRAERIKPDPRNEVARVDIPLDQSLVNSDDMAELVRRVQSETPRAILVAGDEDGMFLMEQAARTGANVLLRFSSRAAQEEAYVDGDRLVF